jgi:hypothetical protein
MHLGRAFARDYERCQLKADFAKLRLSRWGKAVSINTNQQFAVEKLVDERVQLVRKTLLHIIALFREAEETSKQTKADDKAGESSQELV